MTLTFKIKDKASGKYISSLKELAKLITYEFAYNSDEKLFSLQTDKYEITDMKIY